MWFPNNEHRYYGTYERALFPPCQCRAMLSLTRIPCWAPIWGEGGQHNDNQVGEYRR